MLHLKKSKQPFSFKDVFSVIIKLYFEENRTLIVVRIARAISIRLIKNRSCTMNVAQLTKQVLLLGNSPQWEHQKASVGNKRQKEWRLKNWYSLTLN